MTGFDWRLRGNCTVRAAEAFFPLGHGAEHTRAAKALCDGCPVATTCLNWAVETGEPEGIYGGRTPAERRKYGTGPMPEPKKTAVPKWRQRGPRSTTCGKGHRKMPDSRGKWICKVCSYERTVARRKAIADLAKAQTEQVSA